MEKIKSNFEGLKGIELVNAFKAAVEELKSAYIAAMGKCMQSQGDQAQLEEGLVAMTSLTKEHNVFEFCVADALRESGIGTAESQEIFAHAESVALELHLPTFYATICKLLFASDSVRKCSDTAKEPEVDSAGIDRDSTAWNAMIVRTME